jgi:hypothetical protein
MFGGSKMDPYLKSLRDTRRQIRAQEITLDKFLPFMFHNSFIFETHNIRAASRMLTNEDLKRLSWDPETIDWADYWVNIHTKGIEKWIRPMFAPQRKAEIGNKGQTSFPAKVGGTTSTLSIGDKISAYRNTDKHPRPTHEGIGRWMASPKNSQRRSGCSCCEARSRVDPRS